MNSLHVLGSIGFITIVVTLIRDLALIVVSIKAIQALNKYINN